MKWDVSEKENDQRICIVHLSELILGWLYLVACFTVELHATFWCTENTSSCIHLACSISHPEGRSQSIFPELWWRKDSKSGKWESKGIESFLLPTLLPPAPNFLSTGHSFHLIASSPAFVDCLLPAHHCSSCSLPWSVLPLVILTHWSNLYTFRLFFFSLIFHFMFRGFFC